VDRVGTSSYGLGARIVDAAGTVYSTAAVTLVAFDAASGRSRPLSDGERSRLEKALEQ
jgi:acyl-CoA thioesterase FadM